MNIEEIKKRHATEIMFLPIVEGYNQSRNDVEYLLSIIEQAEKDFIRISDLHIRGIEDRAAEPHREIARTALKSIKGEG